MYIFIFVSSDQLFSRIAEYLRRHKAYDRAEIVEAVRRSFRAEWQTADTLTANLDRAANISDWLKPYLKNNVKHLTNFRQFKICVRDNQTILQARKQCAEDPEFNQWCGLDSKSEFSLVAVFFS